MGLLRTRQAVRADEAGGGGKGEDGTAGFTLLRGKARDPGDGGIGGGHVLGVTPLQKTQRTFYEVVELGM
jgi:hypothetical protein